MAVAVYDYPTCPGLCDPATSLPRLHADQVDLLRSQVLDFSNLSVWDHLACHHRSGRVS